MGFGFGVNYSGHIIYLALIVKKMREQSKCWAVAKTDTQFNILDSSALKKQLLIFFLSFFLSFGQFRIKFKPDAV
jgi:hypothetical protein